MIRPDSKGYLVGHEGPVQGRALVIDGLRVDLVPRRHIRGGAASTFWDAYLHDLPEGADDTPLTLGNAQPRKSDLIRWLNDRPGLATLREQAERWCIPRPRWEHGYRGHGLWVAPNTRIGYVGLGPPRTWDGVYRWHVDKPGSTAGTALAEGAAGSLDEAKREVEGVAVRAYATYEVAKRLEPWP